MMYELHGLITLWRHSLIALWVDSSGVQKLCNLEIKQFSSQVFCGLNDLSRSFFLYRFFFFCKVSCSFEAIP